jgi:D-arabinose 1-dehydrogenase-like Zn-dependent alcohol dehydrogenase
MQARVYIYGNGEQIKSLADKIEKITEHYTRQIALVEVKDALFCLKLTASEEALKSMFKQIKKHGMIEHITYLQARPEMSEEEIKNINPKELEFRGIMEFNRQSYSFFEEKYLNLPK